MWDVKQVAGRYITWEGLEGGKERGKRYNYILIAKMFKHNLPF